MMKSYSFYHSITGAIHRQTISTDDPLAVAPNTPADHIAIEGIHDWQCFRVDVQSGSVVEYTPASPSSDHEWNDTSKRWVLKPDVLARLHDQAQAANDIADIDLKSIKWLRQLALGDDAARAELQKLETHVQKLRDLFTEQK